MCQSLPALARAVFSSSPPFGCLAIVAGRLTQDIQFAAPGFNFVIGTFLVALGEISQPNRLGIDELVEFIGHEGRGKAFIHAAISLSAAQTRATTAEPPRSSAHLALTL